MTFFNSHLKSLFSHYQIQFCAQYVEGSHSICLFVPFYRIRRKWSYALASSNWNSSSRPTAQCAKKLTHFFFFFWDKKNEARVVIIVSRLTVQLGKFMGTTSLNWSSKTPNPQTPQTLLVFETSKNCNYSPRENSNLGCGESLSSHLSVLSHPPVIKAYPLAFTVKYTDRPLFLFCHT